MTTLDMLGKPCPMPMVAAQKALATPDTHEIDVLVDNTIAVQNLKKMAAGKGYAFAFAKEGAAQYRVHLAASGQAAVEAYTAPAKPAPTADMAQGATILITKDQMGEGSEELGRILIKGFVFALTELEHPPACVIFLNGGVRLACEGANTLADLQTMQAGGTKIYACGTCLNYYQLTNQLQVGEVTDMMNIARLLTGAGRLITL